MPLETSADPTAGSINSALSDSISDYAGDAMNPQETVAKRRDLDEATAGMTAAAEKEADAAKKTFDQPPPQQDHNPLGGLAPLLLFASFGGPKMKGNANAMLGATTGVVKGYLSGDAEAYQDAVDKYKGAYQQFKDHQAALQKTYKEFREAYKGRIDADIKALQISAKVHGDEMRDQTQLLRMKEMFDQQSEKLDQQVKHWTAEDNVAQQKVDLQRKKALQDVAQGKVLSPKAIDVWSDWSIDHDGKLPQLGYGSKPAVIVARKQIMEDVARKLEATGQGERALLVRTSEVKALNSSISQQQKMLGATQSAVGQLDFNIDKTTQEMKKLGSTDISPVLNAIARGEEKWTGKPAYSSLFFYLSGAATEAARIQSGGQASAAQLHEGAAERAQKWVSINMTPASWASVSQAMKLEGLNRLKNFQDSITTMQEQLRQPAGADTSATGNSASATHQEGEKSTSKSGKPIVWHNGQWEYVSG